MTSWKTQEHNSLFRFHRSFFLKALAGGGAWKVEGCLIDGSMQSIALSLG